MPKEITHWSVCSSTHDSMPPSPLRDAVDRHPQAFLLGSMLYDTPMFSRFLRDGRAFEGVSERLHGAGGEDTVEPVRDLLEGMNRRMDGRTMALVAGLLTHVGVDSAFHPMVYHLTGNYYDEDPLERSRAVVRHRRFEVAVDLHFLGRGMPANGGYYWNSLRESGLGWRRLTPLLSSLWLRDVSHHPDIPRILRWHTFVQYLIRQRWAAAAARAFGPMIDGRWRETLATFYPASRSPAPSWCSRPITYRNPVTGKRFTESLEEMESRAVAVNLRLLDLLAGAGSNPRSAAEALRGEVGPSLETGVSSSRAGDMRFFRARTSGIASL